MQKIKVFAPVMIPTLNRYSHLKSCVESLAKCSWAEHTELYISVDFPPSEKYIAGHKKIIEYVNSITGFKDVHIFIQSENLGVGGNFIFLRDEIFKKFDRVIFTEDDNVFSPCFLEYINKGLELFQNIPNVWGICGYNYPIQIPNSYCNQYNSYFAKEYSAWGAGYLNKMYFLNIERTIDNGKNLLIRHWDKLTWSVRRMLINSIQKNRFPGDLYRTLFLIDSDMYCVFPTENLVVNNGHDGSGVNCGLSKKNRFSTQPQSNENHFEFKGNPPICENKEIRKELNKYFDIPFKSKVKLTLNLILSRIRF